MEYQLDKGCHSVYSLQFHLVLVTKYRKKALVGKLAQRLKEIVEEVAKHFKVRIIEQETDKDHIHILFSGRPALTLSKFVNSLKSVTLRKLRKETMSTFNLQECVENDERSKPTPDDFIPSVPRKTLMLDL